MFIYRYHTCIHTCIHTYIHTYRQTDIHTYIHTCIHVYMPICIHLHVYIYIYMSCASIQKRAPYHVPWLGLQKYKCVLHTYIYTYLHIHNDAYLYTYMYVCVCIHVHVYSCVGLFCMCIHVRVLIYLCKHVCFMVEVKVRTPKHLGPMDPSANIAPKVQRLGGNPGSQDSHSGSQPAMPPCV